MTTSDELAEQQLAMPGEYAAPVAVDLRHFRSFVMVAEEGNIGRAATRMFITQPALSRQLQQLEEELGIALFVRVPRGVELTEAGRELLDKARAALDAAEQALTIGKAAEPAGRLAVGVSIAGHRDLWFELAEAFTARHPRVEVEIRTALSELLQRQIVAGELDVAIVLEPNRLAGLSYQQVRVEPLSVWMHAGHRLADRAELMLADLEGVEVTLVGAAGGKASGFNSRIRGLFARAGVDPVFVEAANLIPLNAMRAPGALTVSIDVGYPDEVLGVQLVPPRSMHYDVVHRTDVGTAGVRAFAAFAVRHAASA
jgi:LysR family transcriptional regulator, benzoate and cis,cis-muconate-responsive activator of ben and cat genes